VLALGPFVTAARAAPRAHEASAGIEDEDRRRGQGVEVDVQRARAVQHVSVVVRVDPYARDVAEPPLIGHERPRRIDFEDRNTAGMVERRSATRYERDGDRECGDQRATVLRMRHDGFSPGT
jgi:hypothetical protein